jgi:superfamily I DNA/RNA helicase
MNLNDEQLLAVEHPLDHPAMVLAGAGSGKSTVLTARVQYLIDSGVSPDKIVCCTFTNKAAGELCHRIGYDPKDKHLIQPRVSTIHSLALSAIRKDPRGFGLSDKVSPLDEYGQKDMINKLIDRLKLETVKSWDLLEKVQYHRARGLGFSYDYTDEYKERTKHAHGGYHVIGTDELELWAAYEKEKTIQSVVDFDDMLHLVVQRGKSDKKWRTKLGNMWDHVLADEVQDLSNTQWEFIRLLVREDNFNIYIVGDVSQSIYGFSGASPEITMEFSKGWRGVVPTLYKLAKNHRSVPQVVKYANLIQSKMTDTIPLKMGSHRGESGDSGTIKLMSEMSARDNAAKMAEQIWNKNILLNGKIAYKDTAILVRSASQIQDIEAELVRCRVPYEIRGGKGLLQSLEAREILSYMRLVVNPRDVQAMARSVSVPKRGIGDAAVEKIRKIAVESFDGDMVQAAIKYNHNKMGMYLDFIQKLTPETKPLAAFLSIIKFTKYHDIVHDRYKKDREQLEWKLLNLQRLEDIFSSIEESAPETSLEDVVFQMTMNDKDQNVSDSDEDGKVTISTIHSSKGLEWNSCYVYNVIEGSLPHMWSTTDQEYSEERRLFYVAVTRARDNLILCVPLTIQRGKNQIQVTPSRFLFETGVIKTVS